VVGLALSAVVDLIERTITADSDSLIVVVDGKVVVERLFGRPAGPIQTRSLTKSLAALAILALVADGAIRSLDERMSTWFPEFADDERRTMTLRHVLTHTSGLERDRSTDDLNSAADRLAYARSLRAVSPPGTRYWYSNEATQLLSGVIAAAAKKPVDAYVRERLFVPLGIRGDTWTLDRAGGVQTYYGIGIGARDLAKIGMMLLAEGRWGERQVLPAPLALSLRERSKQSPTFSLLWWMRAKGDGPHLSPTGPPIAFRAEGAKGQHLAIYPGAKLVVVRQHRGSPTDKKTLDRVTWKDFPEHVEAMLPVAR